MTDILSIAAAFIAAAALVYVLIPSVRGLAFKTGAVDLPRDGRRMHSYPVPKMGGIAIIIGFIVITAAFSGAVRGVAAILSGGIVIAIMGIADDTRGLHPASKLAFQVTAALLCIFQGEAVLNVFLFGEKISTGLFSVVITVIWITVLTNSFNLIDGLDGLSCGCGGLCSAAMALIFLISGDKSGALQALILCGCCIGFLPHNFGKSKMFLGDTGAQFIGWALSVLSVRCFFNSGGRISSAVPLLIFLYPLAEITTTVIRRAALGKNPFSADRGHFHHKLTDLGINQRQTSVLLCTACCMTCIASVLMVTGTPVRAVAVFVAGIAAAAIRISTAV